MSFLFLLVLVCIVGAVGYFVVKKKKNGTAEAVVASMQKENIQDEGSNTAKPSEPVVDNNIGTSTGTESGKKKKKSKSSKRKKSKRK